jgi:hypothetical protein
MRTIRYMWRRRSWKLVMMLYKAYSWPINRTIILSSLLLTYLMLATPLVWVPGWGGR